jgi:transaldolase
MSVHPANQAKIQAPGIAREPGIDGPVEPPVLARLRKLPEFVRAYEPGGLSEADFVTFGATQRTLSQFVETGWKGLESARAQ